MPDAAAGVGLRSCVWDEGLGVFVPNDAGASAEALACAAANGMKTASGRSAAYLFMDATTFLKKDSLVIGISAD
jgi:hypothetical protein